MPFASGEIVTAEDLNHIQSVTYVATATAALNGPQTDGAITGASVTFDSETDNAIAVVSGDFDFAHTGATSTVSTGELYVDGVKQAGEATYQVAGGAINDRGTHSQSWRLALGTAGTHTLDLRATLPTNVRVNQNNTRITVTVLEII